MSNCSRWITYLGKLAIDFIQLTIKYAFNIMNNQDHKLN